MLPIALSLVEGSAQLRCSLSCSCFVIVLVGLFCEAGIGDLTRRRGGLGVRRGEMNYLGDIIDRYSPTFAAFASLREIFRVSVAVPPR